MKYRVGIIGCGRIASLLENAEVWRNPIGTHTAAYHLHPRTEIVAACDPLEERREKFRQKWGVEAIYKDYDEMFSGEKELDIVSVCTRPREHYGATVAAAEKGVKAVYCEKELCLSLAEADKMIEACSNSGAKLIVNHTRRFCSNHRKAKEIVESGEIGALRSLIAYSADTHLFDMMGFFAGEAEWVFSNGSSRAGCLRFKNGVHGYIEGSGAARPAWLDILCTEGMIRIKVHLYQVFELWKPDRNQVFSPMEKSMFPEAPISEWLNCIRMARCVMPRAVDEIIDCIETGKESISTGRDARAALELILAFEESARSGERVNLPLTNKELKVSYL